MLLAAGDEPFADTVVPVELLPQGGARRSRSTSPQPPPRPALGLPPRPTPHAQLPPRLQHGRSISSGGGGISPQRAAALRMSDSLVPQRVNDRGLSRALRGAADGPGAAFAQQPQPPAASYRSLSAEAARWHSPPHPQAEFDAAATMAAEATGGDVVDPVRAFARERSPRQQQQQQHWQHQQPMPTAAEAAATPPMQQQQLQQVRPTGPHQSAVAPRFSLPSPRVGFAETDGATHHWQTLAPPAASNASQPFQQQQQPHMDDETMARVSRQLRARDDEIHRLRASLAAASATLQRVALASPAPVAASTPRGGGGGDDSAAAAAAADSLLVDRAPPHVQGLPVVPLPLGLPAAIARVHGTLLMLETEERRLFRRQWRPRFVVADDRGVTVFRDEADFAAHRFHRAVLTAHYHDLDCFIPSFRDAGAAVQQRQQRGEPCTPSDLLIAAVAREHATHTNATGTGIGSDGLFGFLARQPAAGGGAANPQLVFRTSSHQDHGDWVHFLARCFNRPLYRRMFPSMLPETLFGLICKESQAGPGLGAAPSRDAAVQASHHDGGGDGGDTVALMASPPPPPPALPPSGRALRAGQDLFGAHRAASADAACGSSPPLPPARASAAPTDEPLPRPFLLASGGEGAAAAAKAERDALIDDLAQRQREVQRLTDAAARLRAAAAGAEQAAAAAAADRDEAQDHAAVLQQTLALAEAEAKRLRAAVAEAQQALLRATAAEARLLAERDETRAEAASAAAAEAGREGAAKAALMQELETLRGQMAASLQQLAAKAVGDIDQLHSRFYSAAAGIARNERQRGASDDDDDDDDTQLASSRSDSGSSSSDNDDDDDEDDDDDPAVLAAVVVRCVAGGVGVACHVRRGAARVAMARGDGTRRRWTVESVLGDLRLNLSVSPATTAAAATPPPPPSRTSQQPEGVHRLSTAALAQHLRQRVSGRVGLPRAQPALPSAPSPSPSSQSVQGLLQMDGPRVRQEWRPDAAHPVVPHSIAAAAARSGGVAARRSLFLDQI